MVGWGIAAAAAVHHVHVRVHDLRSRRAECAAAYTRRARAGTAKEKKRKGTKTPERRRAELARLLIIENKRDKSRFYLHTMAIG